MSGGNLNRDLLLNTIKGDMANGTTNAVPMLRKRFLELSEAQCGDIISTISSAMEMRDEDKVSLVVTAPPLFPLMRGLQ